MGLIIKFLYLTVFIPVIPGLCGFPPAFKCKWRKFFRFILTYYESQQRKKERTQTQKEQYHRERESSCFLLGSFSHVKTMLWCGVTLLLLVESQGTQSNITGEITPPEQFSCEKIAEGELGAHPSTFPSLFGISCFKGGSSL